MIIQKLLRLFLMVAAACTAVPAPVLRAADAEGKPAPAIEASAELRAWIREAVEPAESALKAAAGNPFEKGIAELRRKHLAEIQRLTAEAVAAGDQDSEAKLRRERDQFFASRHMVPAADADAPPAVIRKLRMDFRQEIQRLEKERMRNAEPLERRLDALLAQKQETLVAGARSADAAFVRVRREALAKEWLKPVFGEPVQVVPGGKVAVETPSVKLSPLREAVKHLLALGVELSVQEGRATRRIKSHGDLPNGHVEFASVAWVTSALTAEPTEADMQKLGLLEEVKSFSGNGITLGSTAFTFLDKWTGLEGFSLSGSEVKDETLERLVRFRALKRLSLTGCTFSGDRVAAVIGELHGLEQLTMDGTTFGEDLPVSISRMSRLKRLSLSSTPLTDEGVLYLDKLSELVLLDISKTRVSPSGFASLTKLHRLEDLTYLSTAMPDYPVAVQVLVETLPKLTRLRIVGEHLEAADLKPLFKLRDLQSLQLWITEIESIDELPRVKKLDMRTEVLSDKVAVAIGKASHLEELSLACSEISQTQADALRGLRNLVKLGINWSWVSRSCLGRFSSIKSLKELSCFSVDDQHAPALREFRGLTSLRLNGSGITDAGVGKLRILHNLRQISLQDTAVSENAVESLERSLPGCKVMR